MDVAQARDRHVLAFLKYHSSHSEKDRLVGEMSKEAASEDPGADAGDLEQVLRVEVGRRG